MSADRVFRIPSTMHVGPGAAHKVGAEIQRLGLKHVLLVTDAFLASSGTITPVLESLQQAHIGVTIYDQVNSEPTLDHVHESLALYQSSKSQAVIGCGGGSPIDVAKAVSALAANAGRLQDYTGIDKFPNNGPHIVAIPTTAGTGSEATSTTIVTDVERNVKMLIISPWLMPTIALVDPQLTLGMPQHITAATGLDALTHAIEAYVSRRAQPMSDIFALSAVRLIAENLPVAWHEPQNLQARTQTLLGALQAGIAFSNASVALVHGMSRPIGALFNVAHGVSNAALLGVVTRFSLSGAYERYADIARCLGVADQDGVEATALAGAQRIQELITTLKIPSLSQLGVTREKLEPVVEKMAHDALASGSPAHNPRLASAQEIINLYYQAL